VNGVPASLHFDAGETSKQFTISVPTNSNLEGDWSTVVTLVAPSGVSLGSPSTYTLNVHDTNAPSTVQFTVSSSLVNEGGSQVVTVSRTGNVPGSFDVTFNVAPSANGHAVNGVPASLHFDAGETSKQFTITVPSNAQLEGDWSTVVTLFAPSGVSLGSQSTFTLNVHDLNTVPAIAFSSATSDVDEGSSVTITATRSSDDTSRASTATVTATGDSGYTTVPSPITLNWAAGATSASFTVNVPTDSLAQGDRHVTFTLVAGTNANLGTQTTNALTIHDANAPATIGFTSAGSTVGASGGDLTIAVHRYGASGAAASGTVSVSGTAIAGTDFTTSQTMPWTVNFAAGETEKTFTVHVNSVSVSKNIVFTLGSLTGASAAANQQFTITVQENTPASTSAAFQFEPTSSYATSGQVSINVIRSGPNTGTNSVQVWVSGASTSIPEVDYTSSQAMPATLNFGPGDTTRSVVFNILGNHSGMAATRLVLMLASPTGGATINPNSVYTLTIGDSTTGNGTASNSTGSSSGSGSGGGAWLVRNLRTNMTYDRIQWGIDNATSGDTLVVSYATFNESIVINKALTIRANNSEFRPTIDGQGAGRVVDIAADSVVLDGFIIRGSAASGYGVYGHGSSITVRNCQVTGNGYGIFFDGASGAVIQSCNVGQNAYGITFDGTTNSNIVGCTVSANTNYGISLRDASNSNRVESNVVTNNGGEGIEVTESDRNVIIYNDVHDNGGYGVTMHCQFNQVYLNTFRRNSPGNAFYDPGTEPDNNLWNSDGPVKYRYNGVEYIGVVGNFWDNFNGPDTNKDGVSETQFSFGKIVDTNPLVVGGSEITNVQKAGQATESTSPSWTWLLLLAFIPLAGIVIYYFAFVREK
jgi:parallel beta-helix repeat protein